MAVRHRHDTLPPFSLSPTFADSSEAETYFGKELNSEQLEAWDYLKSLEGVMKLGPQTIFDDYIPLAIIFQAVAMFSEPKIKLLNLEEIQEALKFNELKVGGLDVSQLGKWIYLKRNFGTELADIDLKVILDKYIPACQALAWERNKTPTLKQIRAKIREEVPANTGNREGRGGRRGENTK
jgi:hypothetical protein